MNVLHKCSLFYCKIIIPCATFVQGLFSLVLSENKWLQLQLLTIMGINILISIQGKNFSKWINFNTYYKCFCDNGLHSFHSKAFCMHVHFCNINIHINTHTWHMLKYVRVPHSLLPRFIKNHPNRIILSSIWFCRFLFISCERAALRFYVQIFPTFLQTAVICRWTA